ncbi:hypothetical protein RN001_011492 [Aquatica leii]|uniref:Cilia- and flagella-associated protein 206 n=1 Tax=Aquatica leii TaxID=1421715 RepID=A0AAN7SP38_9COLE|nr:hypothetical protein RN001_011492 [Aquatica leii]
MLNPLWGITSGRLPNRNDVQHFVKCCVEKLENVKNPSMITLKMQLHCKENFTNAPSMIQKNRLNLKTRLEPLEKEISEVSSDKNVTDINTLVKKIVFFITLSSGLGNPVIEHVYKEAEAALKSILSDEDLTDFVTSSSVNKQAQLVEFTDFVTGIRLFNRDCEKGGAGIEDLPKILIQAIEVTKIDMEKTLTVIMDNVYVLTTALDRCYQIEMCEESYTLTFNASIGIEEANVEPIKDVLILYRQYEVFIRKITEEVQKMELYAKHIYEQFREALLNVHKSVQFRIAIPTCIVLPLFSALATIWRELQNQTIVLSQLNQLLSNLELLVKDVNIDNDTLKEVIGPEGPTTDAERLGKTTGLVIPSNTSISVLNPCEIKNFGELALEYMGFCAWMFIQTNGGLIPGNPNMGVVTIGNRYYVFSSVEAANAFILQPERYCKSVLIRILITPLVTEVPKVTLMLNNEAQTELHPEPTNIDPKYMWNIWDWKRQALLYANLTRCVTTSSQTIKSRAFEASVTQTYDMKSTEQQTKKDNYTNVPKLSNHIYGLRGRTDDNQHVIVLTRPVDESSLRPKCTGKKLGDVLKKKKA